jgi:hypothetical protein
VVRAFLFYAAISAPPSNFTLRASGFIPHAFADLKREAFSRPPTSCRWVHWSLGSCLDLLSAVINDYYEQIKAQWVAYRLQDVFTVIFRGVCSLQLLFTISRTNSLDLKRVLHL